MSESRLKTGEASKRGRGRVVCQSYIGAMTVETEVGDVVGEMSSEDIDWKGRCWMERGGREETVVSEGPAKSG